MNCRSSPKIFQENLELELRCHNARRDADGGAGEVQVEHSGAVSAFSRVLSAATSGALSVPLSNSGSDSRNSLSPQRVASKSFAEKLDSEDSKTFPAIRLVVDDLSLPLATKTQVRPVLEFLRHLMETGENRFVTS